MEPLFPDPFEQSDPLAELEKLRPPRQGFSAIPESEDPLAELQNLGPPPWRQPPEEVEMPEGIRQMDSRDAERIQQRLEQASRTRSSLNIGSGLSKEEILAEGPVGAGEMAGAAFSEFALGPFFSWMEAAGTVDKGTRQRMRDDYLKYKELFTSSVDMQTGEVTEPRGKKLTANALAVGAAFIPILPSGAIGAIAGRLFKGTGRGAALYRAATSGAVTSGLVGGAESAVLAPEDQKLGATALTIGAGAALGVVGGEVGFRLGRRALERASAADPVVDYRLPRESANETLTRVNRTVIEQMFDEQEPIRRMARLAYGRGKVPEDLDGILQRSLHSSRVAHNPINWGTEVWDARNQRMRKTGESWADIFGGQSDEVMRDYNTLGTRRRNLELWARQKMAKKGERDAKLEVTDEDAIEAVQRINELAEKYGKGGAPARDAFGVERVSDLPARIAADPQRLQLAQTGGLAPFEINVLDDLFKRHRDWGRRNILGLYSVGILDAGQVNNIFAKNKQFINFGRIAEEIQRAHGGSKVSNPLRRIGGAARDEVGKRVRPPAEESALVAAHISRLMDRQIVTRAVVDMAEEFPDVAEEMGIALAKKKTRVVPLSEAEKKVLNIPSGKQGKLEVGSSVRAADRDNFGTIVSIDGDNARVRFINRETGAKATVPLRLTQLSPLREGEDIAAIFRSFDQPTREGNAIHYRIGADGKSRREAWTMPREMLRALSVLHPEQAHWVMRAAGVATKSLRAGATGLRLVFGATNIVRDQTIAPARSKHTYIPALTPVKAFWDEFSTRVVGRKMSAEWDEFLGSGVVQSTLGGMDEMTRGFTLRKVRNARYSPMRRAWSEFSHNPLYPLQQINKGSELFTRFPEFQKSIRAGKSPLVAAFDAAEVSVNFPRGGTFGKGWNQVEAFVGPELQDFASTNRLLSSKRAPKVIVNGLAYITIPALANWAANRDNADYHDLPEWKKLLYYHIPIGEEVGSDGVSRTKFANIPRPIGAMNVLFGLFPEFLARSVDAKKTGDTDIGKRLAEGLIEQTPIGLVHPKRIKQMAPTVLDPLIENFFNEDIFFEKEVVPRHLEKLMPHKRFYDSTPMISRAIGEATGTSPLQVQNIIEGYLGGVGRDVSRSLDPILFGKTTKSEDPQLAGATMPFVGDFPRRFVTRALPKGFNSQSYQDFRNLLEQTEMGRKEVDSAETPEQMEDALRRHPNAIDPILGAMRATNRQLDEWRTFRRETLLNEDMDPVEKADLLLQIDQVVTATTAHSMEVFAGRILYTQQLLDAVF